jgi:hypothetical protein
MKQSILGGNVPAHIYRGSRDGRGNAVVKADFAPLNPRLDLDNHSPTGFEWGYPGSGPAQLALAILADALENDIKAVRLHQSFKFRVIANLPRNKNWQLHRDQVLTFVAKIEEGLRK